MKLLNARARHLALALPIVLSGAAAAVAPAANAATTVYPGTICQPWGGSARSLQANVEYSQFGRVYNDHASSRVGVVCPIPRNNRVQNRIDRVIVYYDDANNNAGSAGTLACRLRSNKVYGDSGIASSVRSTRAGVATRGAWSFTNLSILSGGGGLIPLINDSNYALFCRLPPKDSGRRSAVGTIVVIDN